MIVDGDKLTDISNIKPAMIVDGDKLTNISNIKPAIIVDGDKLTNISNIKPADIWSTGSNQCGISFRTKLVITETFSSSITKDVQIKSVFTNLKDLMSEWHMRSLFTYSLDRLFGLYLMPETFLELIDRNKLYSIPKRIRNLILSNTRCIPVTGDHYITGIATVWESHIVQEQWTSYKIPNLAIYTLLLYLANCRKGSSHFRSSVSNMYRNIDTDRCFMPSSIHISIVEKMVLSKSILCKIPHAIIESILYKSTGDH